MISANLPALQVVIPLLAAPVCSVLRGRRLCWGFTAIVAIVTFAIAIALYLQVLAGGPISYAMGGWAAPWGIEYYIDQLSTYLLLLVSTVNLLAVLFARASAAHEIAEHQIHWFYTAWLLCVTGLLGMTVTGDVFNLFVFLEISSLATYLLVGLGSGRRALVAALKYLIAGTVGATFFLIGIGLLYAATGTLNMADLAARLPAAGQTRTVLTAFTFITVGLAIKAAVYPLHLWLPAAYTESPSAVSVLLAASSTKVAIYALIRMLLSVFGPAYAFDATGLGNWLAPLAAVAMVLASGAAIMQTNAKSLLAYSSVAQIGYILAGIGVATTAGLTAALVHLFNHAMMKTALFMALGSVAYRTGSTRLQDLAGIGRAMPWTMLAFTLAGLSLIGIPLSAGFISKWVLVSAAIERGWWWLAVVILFASLLALAYIWKVVEIAFFRTPTRAIDHVREAPFALQAPLWLAVAVNYYLGIDTRLTVGTASAIARALLGGGG